MGNPSNLKTASVPLTPDGILLVVAMPEELQGRFEKAGLPVLFTGLGKLNATYHLTSALVGLRDAGQPVRAVVNFGTAGSSHFKTFELVEVTRFVQRDMDVTPLGFARGTTPFDHLPPVLEVARRFLNLPSATCGTGDNFEINHPELQFAARDETRQASFFSEAVKSLLVPHYDVVDMEAYALAKVCEFEAVPFVSIKFISDGADHLAGNDWVKNLPGAAEQFFKAYPEVVRHLSASNSV